MDNIPKRTRISHGKALHQSIDRKITARNGEITVLSKRLFGDIRRRQGAVIGLVLGRLSHGNRILDSQR